MKNQVLQFLVPSHASGYKIIQLSGWAGKCIIVPRTELKEIEKRQESKDPGIYFLFGERDESTNQKLYIGESERFYNRLLDHDNKKDFWNYAVIFTGGLDKGKVKYLEFLSTNTAFTAKRYDLVNSVTPKENSLSEFDVIITQDYFDKIKYILEVLDFPVFKNIKNEVVNENYYHLKGDGFEAKALLLEDGSLNVLSGSLAKIKESDSFSGWSMSARRIFLSDNTFKLSDTNISYVLTRDILFKSPSAAAATIAARSINGWTSWKDSEGNTLDENLRN